jgi:uncharacterized membrane protein
MDANIVALIIGIIAAVPGILSLLAQWRKDKRALPQNEISEGIRASKEAAEVVEKYSGEIERLLKRVQSLEKVNGELQSKVQDMKAEMQDICDELANLQEANTDKDALIEEWRKGIEMLIQQLMEHNLTPVWKPTARKGPKP